VGNGRHKNSNERGRDNSKYRLLLYHHLHAMVVSFVLTSPPVPNATWVRFTTRGSHVIRF